MDDPRALADAQRSLRSAYVAADATDHLAALDHLEACTDRSGRGVVWDSFWSAWDAFAGADRLPRDDPASGRRTATTPTRPPRSPADSLGYRWDDLLRLRSPSPARHGPAAIPELRASPGLPPARPARAAAMLCSAWSICDSACFSEASRSRVSMRATTWPPWTMSPSSKSTVAMRPANFASISISSASSRPFDHTIPGGSGGSLCATQ